MSGDTAVSTIKSSVAKELGVAPGSQVCFNGVPLADDATMTSAGVGAQDLLLITKGGGGSVSPPPPSSRPPAPAPASALRTPSSRRQGSICRSCDPRHALTMAVLVEVVR